MLLNHGLDLNAITREIKIYNIFPISAAAVHFEHSDQDADCSTYVRWKTQKDPCLAQVPYCTTVDYHKHLGSCSRTQFVLFFTGDCQNLTNPNFT